MRFSRLLRRNLSHHWRTHVGVLLGTAVATAVLTGALLVGDSVRHSLEDAAAARVGDADVALAPRGRFFRADLAAAIGQKLSALAAPLLRADGVLVDPQTQKRRNRVQVLGVDDRFWRIGGMDDPFAGAGEGIVLSETLAQRLEVVEGNEILVRLRKTGPLSAEAPLSIDRKELVAARLRVVAVLPAASFGRYSLRAEQIAPFNAFVEISWLGARLGLENQANEMLVGRRPGEAVTVDDAQAALKATWTLGDASLELRALTEEETFPAPGAIELRSDRIFLEPAVVDAAARANDGALGVLAYFVNTLTKGGTETPYSVVAAVGPLPGGDGPSDRLIDALIPPHTAADEIVVNRWLADDLALTAGDRLEMRYFVLGPGRTLDERSESFRVKRVVPMERSALDTTLMPPFAGLEDRENCRDWDPGIDVSLSRIRDKDEEYWSRFKGTPKAFLTLDTGRRLFANRFGDLTAIRFPPGAPRQEALGAKILEELDPAMVGLRFEPLRGRAEAAAGEALDFGQLFVGLSFFLILSALVLTSLLFGLGTVQRGSQNGILLALGFTWSQVRRLLLVEGIVVASAGAVLGAVGGVAYTGALLAGLRSVWSGAVAGATITLHTSALTLFIGAATGVIVAALAMWVILRRQARCSINSLLNHLDEAQQSEGGARRRSSTLSGPGALLFFAGALAVAAFWGAGRDAKGTAPFFLAGTLLLVASLCAIHHFLASAARTLSAPAAIRAPASAGLSLPGLALRNAARKKTRSLSVALLLAVGTFLTFAVGVNTLTPPESGSSRKNGTGGFALIGESTLPLLHDLNTVRGREEFGIEEKKFQGASTVQLRLRHGDDASCLNLNRAQTPRLIGVDAAALGERDAFEFIERVDSAGRQSGKNPWLLLQADRGADVVPAVADEATMVWGLGKALGDRIDFVDEQGRAFSVELVGMIGNSILQGSLLIDEAAFTKRFPSDEGYRMLLIDAPRDRVDAIASALRRAGENSGFDVTATEERLVEFMTVQNTYLAMFQVLGSLGLILGSLGLGFLVLRNVFERQAELAMLRAVGLTRKKICALLVCEHGWLLVAGLVFGTVSALVAVWPALRTGIAGGPFLSLTLTLLLLVAGGVLSIWIAAALALRRNLIAALRQE